LCAEGGSWLQVLMLVDAMLTSKGREHARNQSQVPEHVNMFAGHCVV
jgi:hypothetical protein